MIAVAARAALREDRLGLEIDGSEWAGISCFVMNAVRGRFFSVAGSIRRGCQSCDGYSVPGSYHATAYASTLGSAPALKTPVSGSTAIAAEEPRDQPLVTLSW